MPTNLVMHVLLVVISAAGQLKLSVIFYNVKMVMFKILELENVKAVHQSAVNASLTKQQAILNVTLWDVRKKLTCLAVLAQTASLTVIDVKLMEHLNVSIKNAMTAMA